MKQIGTFVLLSLCGSLAAAQAPADADGDGVVSEQEFLSAQAERAARRFAALDADGDGVLSGNELRDRRAMPRGPGPDLARIDTDGDGALSLSELQAVRPELTVEQFNRLDTDGNGLLSASERPGSRFGRGPRH